MKRFILPAFLILFVVALALIQVSVLAQGGSRARGDLAVLSPTGRVIYVDANSTCSSGCGGSWATAYPSLQDALAAAVSGDEIWVVKGIYYPGDIREATFALKSGVALYGGFAGGETSLSERDVAANVTVLSGDIDQNDTVDANGVVTDTVNIVGNNAYHVVTGSGTDDTAVLDGFTVTAGQAGSDHGGGMYNDSSSPTVSNVTFSGNSGNGGGGMSNFNNSDPILTNVTFSGNSGASGGGIYNNSSNPTLTNVTFSNNSATFWGGGGMYNYSGDPILTNITFCNNSADAIGGGMANDNGSPTLINVTFSGNWAQNGGGMSNVGNPTLTNVTFSDNSADYGGGMHVNSGNPTLTNVTFSDNWVYDSGGGLYSNSNPTLTNVIIANSVSGGDCAGSVDASSSNNLIEDASSACGLTDGADGNIIGKDPKLDSLTDYSGPGRQVFPLLSGSPAIDAGTDADCPSTDQRGATRPYGSACDIGAYEFGSSVPTPTLTPTPDATATPTPTPAPVWRFDGFTYRDDDTTPLGGVTMRLYGSNDGPAGPGDWEKTAVTDAGGYFNFHIIEPWNYRYFTLMAEAPAGLVAVEARSTNGDVIAPDMIRWTDPTPGSHRSEIIFSEPTPTPTATPSPTPTPTFTPTPTPIPNYLYLPIVLPTGN